MRPLKLALLLVLAAPLACSERDPIDQTIYGRPPPPPPFYTGSGGGSGGGYGYGYGYGSPKDGGSADAGVVDAGPPVCDDSLKRCTVAFHYPYGGETSVELRGDFRADGWTRGEPLAHEGSQWSATVAVPYGQPVNYKFVVNGSTWVLDPGNPRQVSDGHGNTNSLLEATSCADYTCVQAPDGGVIVNPICDDTLKRCAATFTYPYANEQTVELRGDYRAGAWTTGDALTRSGNDWTVTVPVSYDTPVMYKFLVDGSRWVLDPRNPTTAAGSDGITNSLRAAQRCTQWTCDSPPITPPGVFDWRDSVIYFVFVDRFFDGNPSNNCHVDGVETPGNFQGGDWAGVKAKIDAGYFTDLGVNTLWITVPVQQTHARGQGIGGDSHYYSAYHGYWPTGLSSVESCFGTSQELKDLVTAAHGKNMKVLFDFAMVHVHVESALFQQHADWFWPNNKDGHDCICGQSCDWNADGQRCWFASYLPHWNYTVQGARDYSVGAAIALVHDYGVDGFRLDAIKHVDGSWLTNLRSRVTSEILAAQSPRQRFYMVGETYDFGDRGFIRSFVDPATKLDGQFDFPLRLHLIKALLLRQEGMDELQRFMDGNDDFYGADAVMSTFAGNHDLPRMIHIAEDVPLWGDPYSDGKNLSWANQPQRSTNRAAYERVANAFAVLFTNRGAPLLYYGDEIGLPGAGDPDNRRFMTWSGLSSDQSWLRDRVSRLLAIRKAHAALRRGRRTTLSASTQTWLFKMVTTGDTVYVAVNRGDSSQQVSGLPSGSLSELVTQATEQGPTVTVPARQTRIYVVPAN